MAKPGDWADMTRQEKDDWVEQLEDVHTTAERLDLTIKEVFWGITIAKIPSALVGTKWMFDKDEINEWIEEMGSLEAGQKKIRDSIEEHRRAREELSKPKSQRKAS